MIGFNILSTTVAGAYGGCNGGNEGGGGVNVSKRAKISEFEILNIHVSVFTELSVNGVIGPISDQQ